MILENKKIIITGGSSGIGRATAIVAARETGPPDLPERMTANLKLYEAGQPTRTPWREGELP